MVYARVNRDAIKPALELGGLLETGEVLIGFEKHFLGEV